MSGGARKLCVVTGSRAEYGLLYWLLKEIQADPKLQLQLIVTGMHLSPQFGLTIKQIEADGFVPDARVEMLLSSDTPVGIAKSMGLGVIGFADAFDRLRPDILVVLGDRFEIFAAAQAAMVARIPIAHLHGGELTEGAFDESIRHAISKMASWHFVAAEPYRKRVIQMGETPSSVFNVGMTGLDHLSRCDWLDRPTLEADLGLRLTPPLFLVTYHPVTLKSSDPRKQMMELLNALDGFPDATIILTYPNADTGSAGVIDCIDHYIRANPNRSKAFPSLGQLKYLSLLRQAAVVIGNSSSGLTEAPALKKATVNIGDRQKGRLKASSVIDSPENAVDISKAIRTALSAEFQGSLGGTISLYGQGDVSKKIVTILTDAPIRLEKRFFDLPHDY